MSQMKSTRAKNRFNWYSNKRRIFFWHRLSELKSFALALNMNKQFLLLILIKIFFTTESFFLGFVCELVGEKRKPSVRLLNCRNDFLAIFISFSKNVSSWITNEAFKFIYISLMASNRWRSVFLFRPKKYRLWDFSQFIRQNRFKAFLYFGDKKVFRVDISINLFLLLFRSMFKVLRHQFNMGWLDIDDLHDFIHSAGVSRQLDSR